MIASHASCLGRTGLIVADRSTDTVQPIASLVICAVFVVLTKSRDTRNQRVSLSSRRTDTVGTMSLWHTVGISSTLSCSIRAWVQAFLVVARLIVRAIVVGLTLRFEAL